MSMMKKRDMSIFLGLLMIFSTLAFAFFTAQRHEETQKQNQYVFVTNWRGMNVYAQETSAGTYVYYLQLSKNFFLPLRANPAEAQEVPSPDPNGIYSRLISANRVYLLFDPEEKDEVSLPYVELSRFLANKPFELIVGTTKPYQENNQTLPYHDPWNVTDGEYSVYVTLGNSTLIYRIGNTYVVQGTDMWNLTLAATKFGLIMTRLM